MGKNDNNSNVGCGILLLIFIFWVGSQVVAFVSNHASTDDAIYGAWAAVPAALLVGNLIAQTGPRPAAMAGEAPDSAILTFWRLVVGKKRT